MLTIRIRLLLLNLIHAKTIVSATALVGFDVSRLRQQLQPLDAIRH